MYYLCSINKGTDQLYELVCAFIFAYAKNWFSHNKAHIVCESNDSLLVSHNEAHIVCESNDSLLIAYCSFTV